MTSYKFFIFILIIFFQLLPFEQLFAQLKPTKSKAVVTFVFQNPTDKTPVVDKKFKIESENNKQIYDLETNQEGIASVLVPVNNVYTIHLSNWENFASVTIPEGAYQKHEIPVPYYEIPDDGSPLMVDIPVHIRLLNKEGKAYEGVEELTVKSLVDRTTTILKTDSKGLAVYNLPVGCQYMLSLKGAPNYYKFEIPNKPYAAWTEDVFFERVEGFEKYPSVNKALFNFVFHDLEGKVVEGENFWVQAHKDNKIYHARTNQQGVAQILVPINDTYTMNAAYNLHFGEQDLFLEEGSDIIVETVVYESITTDEWKRRRKEQEDAAALRDEMAKLEAERIAHRIDSLKKEKLSDKAIAELIKNNCAVPIKRTFRIRKAIKAKVDYFQEQIKLNPNSFEDASKPILATLQRFREAWKGKLVVTDITHSMNPYLEEVLIWHILNLREGDFCKYIFFNDGDKKMASAKKIGSTGGIYPCQGGFEDLSQIIETMHVAMENGLGGGEPPENDLEAVLAGIEKKKKVDELILIADSYSRVRDMELLSRIDIPVRIILCGAEGKNNFYRGLKPEVNEEYLTIAHRTNGSVHTLREDILDLSDRKEGEIVEVGEHRYVLRNRQFIKLK